MTFRLPDRPPRTHGYLMVLSGYETFGLAPLQFALEDYSEFLEAMAGKTPEGIVGELRRKSVGFARCGRPLLMSFS